MVMAPRGGRIHVVNLVDDPIPGGVARALGLFAAPPLAALASSESVAVPTDPGMPRGFAADIMVLHLRLGLRRLAWLMLLTARHPDTRFVLVDYRNADEPGGNRRAARRLMLRMATRLVDIVVCQDHRHARWLMRATGIAPDRLVTLAEPGAQSDWNRQRQWIELITDLAAPSRRIRAERMTRTATTGH